MIQIPRQISVRNNTCADAQRCRARDARRDVARRISRILGIFPRRSRPKDDKQRIAYLGHPVEHLEHRRRLVLLLHDLGRLREEPQPSVAGACVYGPKLRGQRGVRTFHANSRRASTEAQGNRAARAALPRNIERPAIGAFWNKGFSGTSLPGESFPLPVEPGLRTSEPGSVHVFFVAPGAAAHSASTHFHTRHRDPESFTIRCRAPPNCPHTSPSLALRRRGSEVLVVARQRPPWSPKMKWAFPDS